MDGWAITQSIGSLIGGIGALIALIYLAAQAASMRKSYSFDSKWRSKNKASALALFYSHSLLPRIGYCSSILSQSSIYEQLSTIKESEMVRFTRDELEHLYKNGSNIIELVKDSVSQLNSAAFLLARSKVPREFRNEMIDEMPPSVWIPDSENKPDSRKEGADALLLIEFWDITSSLLNDLEYFSMCINCGIADGDVLYPSLHQTFFKTISAFYFFISGLCFKKCVRIGPVSPDSHVQIKPLS